jgi:hypothetical protein
MYEYNKDVIDSATMLKYALSYFKQVYYGYQSIKEIDNMVYLFNQVIHQEKKLPDEFKRLGDMSLVETKISDVTTYWEKVNPDTVTRWI